MIRKGAQMNKLVLTNNGINREINTVNEGDIKAMAKQIQTQAPTLNDLTSEQLEQVAKIVMANRLTAELENAVRFSGIDYETEKQIFLDNVSKSKHTKQAYKAGLERLEKYASREKISLLELSPKQADDFIYSLNRDSRSPASIRLDIAGVSSFYSFLHRRHNAIDKNVFIGSKARPSNKAVKPLLIPTETEVKKILDTVPKQLKAGIALMAYNGLRVGALPTLTITAGKFTGLSKAKDIKGTVSPKASQYIKSSKPYEGIKTNTLQKQIERAIKKLHKEGLISEVYSCHDFRHYFATEHYKKNKDIHALKVLLNHASILVTENYLRALEVLE